MRAQRETDKTRNNLAQDEGAKQTYRKCYNEGLWVRGLWEDII